MSVEYLDGLISVKNRGADKTILCFSGPVNGSRFQFYRIFDDEYVNVIYIKESLPGWYQYGLPGAESIEGLGGALKEIIENLGTKEIYCFGSSMGSYAAILYGCYFGAKRILTFGTRTYIHPSFITNSKYIKQHGINEKYKKLKGIVESYCIAGGKLINVCGADEWLDVFHLSSIFNVDGVKCFTIPEAGHNVGAWLKHKGVLAQAMVNSLIYGDCKIFHQVDSFLFDDDKAVGIVRKFVKASRTSSLDECYDYFVNVSLEYPLWLELYQKLLVIGVKLNDEQISEYSLDKINLINPGMIKANYWAGKFFLLKSEWERARVAFSYVLNAKPGLASPIEVRKLNRGLAYSLYMLGDQASAQNYLDESNSGLGKNTSITELNLNSAIGF